MAVGHHGGRADEGEIPAHAEQGKGDPEMPERNSGDPDHGGDDDEGEARSGDPLEPETGNKGAGGEARRIHAEHRSPPDSRRHIPTFSPECCPKTLARQALCRAMSRHGVTLADMPSRYPHSDRGNAHM